MRVAIMAYLLHRGTGYRAAGVSAYIAGIVEHLPLASPQHQYIALHGRDAWVPAGVQSVPSPLPTMRPAVRILWEQTGAIRDARVARADLFHGPVNVVPLLSGLPRVVTIHDLAFLRHPERFRRGRVLYLRAMVAASVRGSRHTIAVSENTRQDLIALLGTPAQGITVVPPGVGSQFAPIPPDGIDTFRRSLFEGRPFILHVGTLEPRKNIDVLIRAFAAARSTANLSHVLALVGGRGWMYASLFELVRELGLQEHVRFAGYVDPAHLPLWYNAADLFAYPSAYEGFGLPVLEAMACGIPTVTSSSGALQELAGDACLTVEPGSVESLQLAIVKVLEDPDLVERLRTASLARAAGFSWMKAAAATAGVYERVARS